MVSKDNGGGVDNQKYILHDNRWGVYMKKKKLLLRVVILCRGQILIGTRLFGEC